MSRAFVKEQDVSDFSLLPARQVSDHPNDVTRHGFLQIETALSRAKKAYSVAHAARDGSALAAARRDVQYWTHRRATAHVVKAPSDDSEVRFGTSVTIERDDGRKQAFQIVGEDEADPNTGTISHVSPLARAMFGKSVGDTVRVGGGEAKIVSIRTE
jgi:transcription elongation GreA/GreB family factor